MHDDSHDAPDDGVADPDGIGAILSWLENLAPGAVIRWGDDGTLRAGALCGWLDILSSDGPAGLNWIWTVVGRDDEDAENPEADTILCDYNVDLHMVWDAEARDWVEHVAVPRGSVPDPVQQAVLDEAVAATDGEIMVCGAWTPQRVSDQLAIWVALHSTRADITFAYDPDIKSRQLFDAQEHVAAILDGSAEIYDLGGGVQATGDAMDLFCHDPELAIAALTKLREITGQDPL
jgi:hypothetical protein